MALTRLNLFGGKSKKNETKEINENVVEILGNDNESLTLRFKSKYYDIEDGLMFRIKPEEGIYSMPLDDRKGRKVTLIPEKAVSLGVTLEGVATPNAESIKGEMMLLLHENKVYLICDTEEGIVLTNRYIDLEEGDKHLTSEDARKINPYDIIGETSDKEIEIYAHNDGGELSIHAGDLDMKFPNEGTEPFVGIAETLKDDREFHDIPIEFNGGSLLGGVFGEKLYLAVEYTVDIIPPKPEFGYTGVKILYYKNK